LGKEKNYPNWVKKKIILIGKRKFFVQNGKRKFFYPKWEKKIFFPKLEKNNFAKIGNNFYRPK
jgi:hypothetical protein